MKRGVESARGCTIIASVVVGIVLAGWIDTGWLWMALAFELTAALDLHEPRAPR